MSEDLYELPRETISQGDILELLPNAHITHPLRSLVDSSGVYRESTVSDPPMGNFQSRSVAAQCRPAKAMLITYDCEIDKPSVKNWIVCPVVPLSEIPGSAHGDIKKNKIFSFLYLPKYRDILIEDSAIVLNRITTLDRIHVETAKRIVSLSDFGRRAFYSQSIRWLTRWQLAEIRCPQCAVSFNAVDGMTVRTD